MERTDRRRDKESELMSENDRIKEVAKNNVVIILKKDDLELLKDIVIESISNKSVPAERKIQLAAKLIEACEENK